MKTTADNMIEFTENYLKEGYDSEKALENVINHNHNK